LDAYIGNDKDPRADPWRTPHARSKKDAFLYLLF